jgi:hypothetical protein
MRLDSSASFVDRLLGYPCGRLGVCFCSAPCPTIEVILNERNPSACVIIRRRAGTLSRPQAFHLTRASLKA